MALGKDFGAACNRSPRLVLVSANATQMQPSNKQGETFVDSDKWPALARVVIVVFFEIAKKSVRKRRTPKEKFTD
jgi:hypothetical protein